MTEVQLVSFMGIIGIFLPLIRLYVFFNDIVDALFLLIIINRIWYDLVQIPSEVIFLGSISESTRNSILIDRKQISTVSQLLSPVFTSIILFFVHQRDWTAELLRKVVIIGEIISISQTILLFFFVQPDSKSDTGIIVNQKEDKQIVSSFFTELRRIIKAARSSSPASVPYWMWLHSLLISIGAGSMVRYLPGFLRDRISISAKLLSITQIIQALFLLALTQFAKWIVVDKQQCSRAAFTGLALSIALVLLVVMLFTEEKWTLITLYISRAGFQTATGPFSSAILLDFAPVKDRAFWTAGESLTGVAWSLASGLGGFLISNFGFGYLFAFAGIMYMCALAVFIIASQKFDLNGKLSDSEHITYSKIVNDGMNE